MENDQAALQIAQLACNGIIKKRNKIAKRRKSLKSDEDKEVSNQSSSGISEGSPSSPPIKRNVAVSKDTVKSEDTDDKNIHSLPKGHLQMSPELTLPLRSMYDGTGAWPKQNLPRGAEQLSWANIGFPNDESLVVEDIEDSTYIDGEKPSIIQLSQDILDIKTQDSVKIAEDGKVKTGTSNNRTIETFKLHGRTVCKVKFSDCKVSNPPYSNCKTSKEIEGTITEAIGKQPSVSVVQSVASHIILARAGQIGGRSHDYWVKARDLAQQQLHINPSLEKEVQQQMEKGVENDPAFAEMLAIVKKSILQNSTNSYFQSKRDKYGVANGLFYRVKDTDISKSDPRVA